LAKYSAKVKDIMFEKTVRKKFNELKLELKIRTYFIFENEYAGDKIFLTL
jgi:hypothetical protein